MSKTPKSLHVIISGRVQGVGFRAWTVKTANKLGVSGWVRNRTDGTVEAVFLGDGPEVDALLAECRKRRLPARVDAIAATEWEGVMEPGFIRLPTV